MEPFLMFDAIRKNYGEYEALRGVTGVLYPGEVVALLGANGAGKTTLSGILAGLHPVTSGMVVCNGCSIYEDIAAYRFRVGYCAQKVYGNDMMTVRDQLWYAGRCFGMDGSSLWERVDLLIGHCSLGRVAHLLLHQLSGGYKQRFNIARSLVHDPQLIILDEPTVALDPHVRRAIWDLIISLRTSGKTILITTHYIDEAEFLADRVCFLDRGVVHLFDAPQVVLQASGKGRLEEIMVSLVEQSDE